MTKKKWISIIATVVVLFVAILFVRGTFFQEETTLLEVAKNSTYFEEDKPFLAESIISGYMTYRYKEESAGTEISESDAQDIIDLLATTKVKKTLKSIADVDSGMYILALDNNGYTMSYDLAIDFLLKENKDNEILITTNYSDEVYILEDSNFYNKLVEILKKAPL
ncbi:hypothetical protein DCE79_16210 [Lysinibacillus sp. 2017]|uniref:hypothetical protein n=1 Tax=unclassified Lysinibacillus TaxID=2636778 RepID=UPI000D5291A9|nr:MULTISPECIES: hypothetical protein [unclassified Lysinibacillus]AWE08804.1 hypothetical protein DCE79_16210 [Lysinibacillus sp. 2017]TGN36127.1 hypothetical protein E4L99_06590 [Lysinibacillus sp. S2017]